VIELKQTETFRKWRSRLRDERAKAMIASRLDRLAHGHAGDKSTQAKDIKTARRLAETWSA
jgi:putative component of toxin-antitoxin plasmid stabilization module